jgi:rod shape-determining protein MreC
MSDEKIEIGDSVITTGGDRVFPKGLKVGTVASVAPDYERDPFLSIKIKPAADLSRLEEVLVITELGERVPSLSEEGRPMSASEMLAQRLPSAKKKVEETKTPAASAKPAAQPQTPLAAEKPRVKTQPVTAPAAEETPR